MEISIKLLYDKLNEEYEILEKIKRIEEQKYIMLIEGKLVDFSEHNETLEVLVKLSMKAEKERIPLTKTVLNLFGLKDEAPISEIIPHLDKETQVLFLQIQESFKDILVDIRAFSSANKEMLNNTLRILDISLSQITGEEEIDYGRNEKDKKISKSLLINKLA